MTYRATILSKAEFDEADIYAYLAQQSAATAHRFVDKVDETLDALCRQSAPGLAWISENTRLEGLRWAKVRGFPNHLIFFRLRGEWLEVVRILHAARDLESIL